MIYSVTSLKDFCLIKLVEELDHYSPELLACLPPPLRRLLLVHLPIVDVCQLEQTCVFEDVNAEDVWKEIYDRQIPKYFTSLESFPPHSVRMVKKDLDNSQVTAKHKFLSIISNIILGRARPSGHFAALRNHGGPYCKKPPRYILSIAPSDIVNCLVAGVKMNSNLIGDEDKYKEKEVGNNVTDSLPDDEEEVDYDLIIGAMTDYDSELPDRYKESYFQWERGEHFLEYDAYKETNEKFQYFSPRYSKYVSESSSQQRLSDEDAIKLLMKYCGFRPDNLFISISAYSSKIWNQNLISQFLSQVVSLALSFDQFIKGVTEMEKFLVTVLSAPKPKLSSLSLHSYLLDNWDNMPEDHLVGDDHLAVLDQLCGSSILLPSSVVSPLQSLTHFFVAGRITTIGLNKVGAVLSCLPMMVYFSFKSITFFWNADSKPKCSQQFATALSVPFRNPSFKYASLDNIEYSSAMIQDVITSYLTIPCIQDQTLKLNSVVLKDSRDVVGNNMQQNVTVSESALHHKSLEICVDDSESFSKLTSWFFSSQVKLKELSIFCCYDDPLQKIEHIDCLSFATQNKKFQVECLSVCIPNGVPAAAMSSILKMGTLKKLKMVYCNSSINFDDLAENLLMQMSDKMLDELKIEGRNDIGARLTTSSNCTHFCDIMFSMPQLQDLDFELCLNRHHKFSEIMERMYESWKRNSKGRKPRRLFLHFELLDSPGKEEWRSIASEMGLSFKFCS